MGSPDSLQPLESAHCRIQGMPHMLIQGGQAAILSTSRRNAAPSKAHFYAGEAGHAHHDSPDAFHLCG